MRKGSIVTLVLLSATAMAAIGLACSGEDATDTKSNTTSSDSTFIESVEAAANEAVGMSSTELTVEDEAVVAADMSGEMQNAAPTSIGYSQPENIDGVPIKDIDIVAKESNVVATESAEDIVTRELVAWETPLDEHLGFLHRRRRAHTTRKHGLPYRRDWRRMVLGRQRTHRHQLPRRSNRFRHSARRPSVNPTAFSSRRITVIDLKRRSSAAITFPTSRSSRSMSARTPTTR